MEWNIRSRTRKPGHPHTFHKEKAKNYVDTEYTRRYKFPHRPFRVTTFSYFWHSIYTVPIYNYCPFVVLVSSDLCSYVRWTHFLLFSLHSLYAFHLQLTLPICFWWWLLFIFPSRGVFFQPSSIPFFFSWLLLAFTMLYIFYCVAVTLSVGIYFRTVINMQCIRLHFILANYTIHIYFLLRQFIYSWIYRKVRFIVFPLGRQKMFF